MRIASFALLALVSFQALATNDLANVPGMPELDFMTGDDRWGCEVLLCLANPNGPKAVSECHPPIDKLFKCLAKHNPCDFPKCPMAGDGNYAQQLRDGFDPCSIKGMDDAPKGYIAEPGPINKWGKQTTKNQGFNYGGEAWSEECDSEGRNCRDVMVGTKACVKKPLGVIRQEYSCGDSEEPRTCYRTVRLYEEVLWQKYQSRRAIDVFIDGKNWTRVHW